MPSRGRHVQMPRGRRATELGCAALQATRVRDWGDKGHVGQEDRASKPQGLGGDFFSQEGGETQGTLEHGTGGVVHFSGLLQDRVSHRGASWRSEETREAERTAPGASDRGSLGAGEQSRKCLWVDLLSRQGHD